MRLNTFVKYVKKIKHYYSSIIEQLDTLLETNPQKYWEILGNLIHADKPDNFEISSDQWFDYYKDLNKKPIRYSLDIFNKLKELEQNKVYTELDSIITVKEISDAIGSLKNNKSSSFDSILNEILKSGQTFIIEIFHQLFNSILSNGSFPKIWAKGIIVDKYCQQGSKRLFSCFVDFRRAFDTVRHEELFS